MRKCSKIELKTFVDYSVSGNNVVRGKDRVLGRMAVSIKNENEPLVSFTRKVFQNGNDNERMKSNYLLLFNCENITTIFFSDIYTLRSM